MYQCKCNDSLYLLKLNNLQLTSIPMSNIYYCMVVVKSNKNEIKQHVLIESEQRKERNLLKKYFSGKVMYGRKGSEDAPVNQNCLGGENMNVETAIVSRHRNIIE